MLTISKNWSTARKSLNFGITAFYTLLIFGLSVNPVPIFCLVLDDYITDRTAELILAP